MERAAPVTLRPAGLVGRPAFIAALLDALPVGIVACDADGAVQLFNRATEEWHGLPAEPVPPDRMAEHYHLFEGDGTTPLRPGHIPLLRALAGEDVVEQELVIAPRHGDARHVRATGRRITDDDGIVLGAVVAMRDDTERLAAVEALAAERAELVLARADQQRLVRGRALHAATGRLLAADSLDAAQQRLVDAALEVLGADAAQLAWDAPGEHRRRLVVGTPEGHELAADVTETPAGDRDGGASPSDAGTDGPPTTTGDAPPATLTVWRADPWTEDERLLLSQLGTIGAQATRGLRLHHRLAAAASRRLRDELLSAVSHQMQTPLATIVGLSSTLDRGDLDEGTHGQVVEALQRQARTLRLLVLGFLDHARLAAGQPLQLQVRPVPVAEVIDHVVARYANRDRLVVTDGARGAVDGPPVVALVDEVRLEQVLGNLLDNAHAHGDGAVQLDLDVREQQVVVTVRDHGPGLGDDPARLFTAAAQGRSRDLDVAGSGIGLHLGRQLVELQGGTLDGRDHPDGGAVLELRLPLADDASDEPSEQEG